MSTIRRVKRKTPFVQIDKRALQDKSLSWKAKGLLAYLLSLPDNWRVYVDELKNHSTDGRESTRTAVNQLMKSGYLKRSQLINDKGQFEGYDYAIFEEPMTDEQFSDYVEPENGFPDNGKSDIGKHVTTNNDNTNKEDKENLKTDSDSANSLVLFEDEPSIVDLLEEQLKEEKISAQKEEKTKLIEDAIYLIGVLNQFANRKFPTDPDGRGRKNVDYIVSLLKKKAKGKPLYSVEDLELMIQYKCFEWVGNPKMEKHLQPVTLFKRHGEDYIQESTEAKDNPAFLAVVKKAKEEEGKTNGQTLSTAGAITHDVANKLNNW